MPSVEGIQQGWQSLGERVDARTGVVETGRTQHVLWQRLRQAGARILAHLQDSPPPSTLEAVAGSQIHPDAQRYYTDQLARAADQTADPGIADAQAAFEAALPLGDGDGPGQLTS